MIMSVKLPSVIQERSGFNMIMADNESLICAVSFQGSGQDVRVGFYDSAIEVALMHFLRYLQDADISHVPAPVQKSFEMLRDDLISGGNHRGIFSAALAFLNKLDRGTVDTFQRFSGSFISKPEKTVTSDEIDNFVRLNSTAVKRIEYPSSYGCSRESMCTVCVPEAYLFRTSLDKNGFMKIWPCDDIMDAFVQNIGKNSYFCPNDLDRAVDKAVHLHSLGQYEMKWMMQCLMTNALIDYCTENWDGRSRIFDLYKKPFNLLMAELFRKVGAK